MCILLFGVWCEKVRFISRNNVLAGGQVRVEHRERGCVFEGARATFFLELLAILMEEIAKYNSISRVNIFLFLKQNVRFTFQGLYKFHLNCGFANGWSEYSGDSCARSFLLVR